MGNLACCADDEALDTTPGARIGISPIRRSDVETKYNYCVESKETTKDKNSSLKEIESDPASSKTSSEAGLYIEDMSEYKWDGPEDPDEEI